MHCVCTKQVRSAGRAAATGRARPLACISRASGRGRCSTHSSCRRGFSHACTELWRSTIRVIAEHDRRFARTGPLPVTSTFVESRITTLLIACSFLWVPALIVLLLRSTTMVADDSLLCVSSWTVQCNFVTRCAYLQVCRAESGRRVAEAAWQDAEEARLDALTARREAETNWQQVWSSESTIGNHAAENHAHVWCEIAHGSGFCQVKTAMQQPECACRCQRFWSASKMRTS
jgi:hypothetical protein